MNAALLTDAARLDCDRLQVEGDDHRHLFRARRLGPGAQVRVTDGEGRQRLGTVAAVGRRAAEIELGEWLAVEHPIRKVTVMVASPRAERARWLVEKLVELGVAEICFIRTERVNHPIGAGLERLGRVAKSALLQSGSARLPRLEEKSWDEALRAALSCHRSRFLLAPGAEEGLVDACEHLVEADSVEIWIGPEGGLTASEESQLRSCGARRVHLGRLVLRVETAATVAAGILLAR